MKEVREEGKEVRVSHSLHTNFQFSLLCHTIRFWCFVNEMSSTKTILK